MNNDEKQRKVNFIKGFSTISVNEICKKLNIDRSNVVNGKTSYENICKVYDMLILEITDMINKVVDKNE